MWSFVPPVVSNFPRILWNPKFHYHVHRSTSLIPILGQINLVHSLSSSFIIISFSCYPPISVSFCKVVCCVCVSRPKPRMHCFSSPYFIQTLLPFKAIKANKVVLRITYEMRQVRLVEPVLSDIVNNCILLFPFCILHLVPESAERKFMKQLNGFLTLTYIV